MTPEKAYVSMCDTGASKECIESIRHSPMYAYLTMRNILRGPEKSLMRAVCTDPMWAAHTLLEVTKGPDAMLVQAVAPSPYWSWRIMRDLAKRPVPTLDTPAFRKWAQENEEATQWLKTANRQ